MNPRTTTVMFLLTAFSFASHAQTGAQRTPDAVRLQQAIHSQLTAGDLDEAIAIEAPSRGGWGCRAEGPTHDVDATAEARVCDRD